MSFDAGRDRHVDRGDAAQWSKWICTQTEVVFACSLRWFRIDTHPKAVQTVQSGQIWELCQKGHSESSFRNIASLYSKVSIFRKDSRSSFSFCIQASRQKSAHRIFQIHGKVSMFILKSLRISSCSCFWSLLLYMTDWNQKSLCKHLNT